MSNTLGTVPVAVMDPGVKSLLTTVIGYAATGLATWATGIGIIPSADRASFINIVVAVILWLIALGVAWYKKRSQSKDALINVVNATKNGVDVVKAGSGGIVVNKAQV
jgi:formate hydrogenlyase subunit 3/multisubunit Na+/H+ antiporter MnhD subunit